MVYQDHPTKFIVLRPLLHKSAKEVVDNLFDIICLLEPAHIIQSDNEREFKKIKLASMLREKWPDSKSFMVSLDIFNHKDRLRESTEKFEGARFSHEKVIPVGRSIWIWFNTRITLAHIPHSGTDPPITSYLLENQSKG